jgi:hypothetical protein
MVLTKPELLSALRNDLLELLQYLTIVVVGLQLFLSLKSCGREDLSTLNLWAGMD